MGPSKKNTGVKGSSRDPDAYTTYLGIQRTNWEFDNLDMKYEIHVMVLAEHGLVNPKQMTNSHIARPMLGDEPLRDHKNVEEASLAIIHMKPTGKHFETDDGMDDPYVWTRRGPNGVLTIKRQSKVAKNEVTGSRAFTIRGAQEVEQQDPAEGKTRGRKRCASTALPNPEANIEVDADEQMDKDDTPIFIQPARPIVYGKNTGLKVKQTAASKAVSFVDVPEVEAANTRHRLAAKETEGAAAQGATQAMRSGPSGQQAGIRKVKPAKENKTKGGRVVKHPRPVEIGVADIPEEKRPVVGLPPMKNGKTVWKDQKEFDRIVGSNPDIIAARAAKAKRTRRAASDAISPLNSNEPKRLMPPLGLSIAEQKHLPGLLEVEALQRAQQEKQTARAFMEKEQEAGRKEGAKVGVSGVAARHEVPRMGTIQPPPFTASPESRKANPLLDELVRQSAAETTVGAGFAAAPLLISTVLTGESAYRLLPHPAAPQFQGEEAAPAVPGGVDHLAPRPKKKLRVHVATLAAESKRKAAPDASVRSGHKIKLKVYREKTGDKPETSKEGGREG